MNSIGLSMASRYSYPPNSLSLCGPQRQADLRWYAGHQTPDGGTKEILEQFATLYPYLRLIAGENRLKDPFDPRVVEAYWLGNPLLTRIPVKTFVSHLSEGLGLKRKLPKKKLEQLFDHAGAGALPNHAFHVAAIYKRTGHADIPHTLATMDACIINWGTVVEKSTSKLITETRPLVLEGNRLAFGPPLRRRLVPQGPEDVVFNAVAPGDTVSYHWGYLCEKLSKRKLANLILYTNRVDTVLGISGVTLFRTLKAFAGTPRFTVHDTDLMVTLPLLMKLKKIRKVAIIGVPPDGDVIATANAVAGILTSVLSGSAKRSSYRGHKRARSSRPHR